MVWPRAGEFVPQIVDFVFAVYSGVLLGDRRQLIRYEKQIAEHTAYLLILGLKSCQNAKEHD